MVSSLVQLENLDVSCCEDLKQVIMVKGVEEIVNTELIFPRLNSILLLYCDKLSSFYAGSYALKFQSAIKIRIEGCRNMITFASTFSTEQEKETTYRGSEGHLGKKEADIFCWTLFSDTVDIPLLDDLYLHSSCVQQIWHSQITLMSSFVQNLRKLTLWYCNNLKYLFTSSMVKSLGQLEVLNIEGCKEMQVVILIEELGEKEKTSQTMFPKLDNLKLCDLLQLIRFYSNCNSLGEVYEAQGHNGSGSQVLAATQSNLVERGVTQLVFPQVTNLELRHLPNFKGFSHQIHITKWPLLKRMLVEQCDKVKTFASEFPSTEITDGDNQLERQTQDPMFWIGKDSFSCLEELEVRHNYNMKEIWHGQYPGVYFPKLKDIKLEFRKFQKCSALPPFFFQTLPSIEKLVVNEASFHEIFQCERLCSEGRPVDAPSRLSELKLSKVNGLRHLWKEESELKSIFYNLRTLEVLECITLVNLVPSVVSFENLQTLEISKCHGLENLLSYSTAKSLEQLKRMSITDCDLVEEIVKCLEDDVKDGIVFSQLKSLQLLSLPKLSSFCTGKCDFEFPSLKKVIVIRCPLMKYFSLGKTVTKELQNVQWIDDEEKGHWVGDLNSTIQDLFTQKVGCLDQFGNLKLSNFFEIEIWKRNPNELLLSLKKVQYLEVSNCSRLRYLLTLSLVLSLVQLKGLKVKYCAAMEHVIMATGGEEVVETGFIFPQLNSILLESCSKLSSYYLGSNTLKFPMLKKIIVKKCLMRVGFASKFSSDKEKEIADGRSEEVHVKEEPDIFNGAFFCDEYLFTFSMVKSFAQLKELKISGCEMMEVVILIEETGEEEKICQTVFPKLETLTLNDLPQLATFCSNCDSLGKISDSERDNFGTGSQTMLATQLTLVETDATKPVFPQVTVLMLRLLPKFKSFFPQMHIMEWPSLESLVVVECHAAQIVASKFSSIEITHGDSQLERESQHPMFWISKATFPSLERLVVKWNDNIKIQCGHHPEEYFGKLKVLHLLGFPKQSAFLLPFFFHSLPNLKKLLVKDAFFDEIFQCEEVTAEEKPVCGRTPLRKLRLSKLHELTHLWKEESRLETLVVSECHGFINLVRYSTAKSLGQLRRMKVANCEMIEEIVVCLGDAVNNSIAFTKLECLQLKGLPRLESFCSGDCNFEFPALREVIITECPHMQIFSKGELSTPRLYKVKLTGDIYEYMDKDIDEDMKKTIDDVFNEDEDEYEDEYEGAKDEGSWEGNLNSTIQQLFKEKSARNSKKGNEENNDHDAKEDGN
ncbi:hypothetical protein SLEP1_g39179 [Rubroshorea leprosula]|uniref:Disease resistance protein At4g27190-like leucine-rich repeats domain-containing protein n=1 Tax=Rubroshorea leprosula TaxID=152421 RepID=A0AAV5KZT0_9ROSI|nr:hypothetical protein SLEP1_g39179 [Rubroshorea leprosula]